MIVASEVDRVEQHQEFKDLLVQLGDSATLRILLKLLLINS